MFNKNKDSKYQLQHFVDVKNDLKSKEILKAIKNHIALSNYFIIF